MILFHCAVLYFLAFKTARVTADSCATRWQGDEKKIRRCMYLIVPGSLTAVLLLGSGVSMRAVQTIILSALLCYMSYSDLKTMEIDDHLHIMVLLTAMMTMTGDGLLSRIVVAVTIGALAWLLAMLPKTVLGGADVKFLIAGSFLMPAIPYLMGVALGSLLGIGVILQNQQEGKAWTSALLPYLSVGIMAAFLLVDIL